MIHVSLIVRIVCSDMRRGAIISRYCVAWRVDFEKLPTKLQESRQTRFFIAASRRWHVFTRARERAHGTNIQYMPIRVTVLFSIVASLSSRRRRSPRCPSSSPSATTVVCFIDAHFITLVIEYASRRIWRLSIKYDCNTVTIIEWQLNEARFSRINTLLLDLVDLKKISPITFLLRWLFLEMFISNHDYSYLRTDFAL